MLSFNDCSKRVVVGKTPSFCWKNMCGVVWCRTCFCSVVETVCVCTCVCVCVLCHCWVVFQGFTVYCSHML